MTTIVWKDGVLAADTRMVSEDHRYSTCTKIRYINKDIVISCAGDVNNEVRAINYFAKPNWASEEPPSVKKGGFQCIIIIKDQPFYCDHALYPQPIEHKYFAIGTGAPYACAYMELGHPAVEAVKFASKFDVNTNDVVTTYVIKDHAKKASATKKPKATE